jgi:hypothetical protein
MRAKESATSARIIERGGGPYHEYRDTAMSRLASYRPGRIKKLGVVGDDDPGNPAVIWNSGHLSATGSPTSSARSTTTSTAAAGPSV